MNGMRYSKRLGSILLNVALWLAVIVSIVLADYVWTSDSRFAHIQTQSENPSISRRVNKTSRNLFMPTGVYHRRNGQLYAVNDERNNLPLEFSKELRKTTVNSPLLFSQDQKNYHRFLRRDGFLQLTYNDQVTFAMLDSRFKHHKASEFNRIFIPFAKSKYIWAGNDKNYRLYRLAVKPDSFKRLLKVASLGDSEAVRLNRMQGREVPFYTKPVTIKVYSYLVNHQADSYFAAQLLGTAGVSRRNSRNGKQVYALNGGIYQRLTTKPGSNQYDYFNYYGGRSLRGNNGRLTTSSYYVEKIGLLDQDLRFFEADGQQLSYQNYVESYPVFVTSDDQPQAELHFRKSGMALSFNSTDLQIPIPYEGKTVTLPATTTVYSRLEQSGLRASQLENFLIGFTLKKDSSHDKLVNLQPTYFVKIAGRWHRANDWISSQRGGHNGLQTN